MSQNLDLKLARGTHTQNSEIELVIRSLVTQGTCDQNLETQSELNNLLKSTPNIREIQELLMEKSEGEKLETYEIQTR